MIATQTKAKERPILFSGPMVRAILDGRKTMTRRVVKGCAGTDVAYWPGMVHGGDFVRPEHCPYGKPGDRLWVRETWRYTGDAETQYAADGARIMLPASVDERSLRHTTGFRPSIHMPRWASRITLEVVSVRVEQLQAITADDCRAEGCPTEDWYQVPGGPEKWYRTLWDEINGDRGHAWAFNPWVWVVEFKVVPNA